MVAAAQKFSQNYTKLAQKSIMDKDKVVVEVPVIIVGAGPSGLATAASLTTLSVPSLILERDDCIAPLWRKRTYDRLHLHLAKRFSQLPHFPHPPATPTFFPKNHFLNYLDDYAAKFNLANLIHFSREVKSASFDEQASKWRVSAQKNEQHEWIAEEYVSKYLVIASGQNDFPWVPQIPGMDTFPGEVMHSSRFRSGSEFKGKSVLVVGSGNSGMEIAHDLCTSQANTSLVVRNPYFHLISREIWMLGMLLLKYLPLGVVDAVTLFLCHLKFGDTSKYGIHRPTKGPFYLKNNTPIYPVMDVGTFQKIKTGEIQILPSITSIKGNFVTFSSGKSHPFDAIILATGYRSMVKNWLKGDDNFIDDDGMCKQKYPNHWKGKNGLYCAGLGRRGIFGIAEDALRIADDIKDDLKCESNKKDVAFDVKAVM